MKKILVTIIIVCFIFIGFRFSVGTNFEYSNWETEITEDGFEWIKGTKIIKEYHGNDLDVVIPEGCTEIKTMAFENESGKKIKSITIPASVVELNHDPFENCYSLEKIIVSEGNPNYCSIDGILYRKDKRFILAYPCAKTGDSYTMLDEETSISGSSFKGNFYIKTIYMNENMRDIMSSDFAPSHTWSLSAIRKTGFKESDELSLRVVVMPEDKDEVGRTPYKLTISEGTTNIEDYAFEWWSALKYVTIPEGVTSVGSGAFYRNKLLENIVFPRSVDKVGGSNFTYDFRLKSVIMIGKTQEEMEKILEYTSYDDRPDGSKAKLYTGLDMYMNDKKVDFDFAAPHIGDKGKIQIPIHYVLDAYGVPYRKIWYVDDSNDEWYDEVYLKKDEGEIKIPLKATTVNNVLYCTMEELKDIMKLFDMKVTYDKNNYRIDIVDKVK